MNAFRKLERDFILADHATVEDLLSQLGEEDVMTRFGLEGRLDELKKKIAALEDTEDEPTASAALFFGGRPVVGSRGIECEFGGEAVAVESGSSALALAWGSSSSPAAFA